MLYNFLKSTIGSLLKPRIQIEGKENIPGDGALVVICNHRHALDPIAVGLAFRRPVNFLAKDNLFDTPFKKWFLTKLNCIPIDRESTDRTAIRKSIEVLDRGEILGVFPEGTRSRDGKLLPFKGGVSFIASQAPCTIVPMAVSGAERLFKIFRPKVKLIVGEPFPYEKLEGEKRRQTMERITLKQQDSVRLLLERLDGEK